MTFERFLWAWLWVFALIALLMVLPAFRRTDSNQIRGRLVSTALVLIGLDLAAQQRMFENAPLTHALSVAIPLIDIGLFGYVLFLPEEGVLALLSKVRQRWKGRGGGDL